MKPKEIMKFFIRLMELLNPPKNRCAMIAAMVSTMISITFIVLVRLFPGILFPSDKLVRSGPVFLDQNWSSKTRQKFYTTSQGSQIMTYSWFTSLERADSREGFYADGLKRHGFIPNPRHRKFNPDGLPVGWVLDKDKTGRWIGLTCAACHTNQIEFGGTLMQIDGGARQEPGDPSPAERSVRCSRIEILIERFPLFQSAASAAENEQSDRRQQRSPESDAQRRHRFPPPPAGLRRLDIGDPPWSRSCCHRGRRRLKRRGSSGPAASSYTSTRGRTMRTLARH